MLVINSMVLLLALYFSLFVLASAFTIPQRPHAPSITRLSKNALEPDETSLVQDMLWQMTSYFSSMVDSSNGRFYSLSRPPSGELVHQHCPIRDLGVTWDATTAVLFWGEEDGWQRSPHRQRLLDAVFRTIQVYNASYISFDDGFLALDADILREPPNIAHSGFLLLASTNALRLSLVSENELPPMDALTRGILSRQREDGSFRIEFDSDDVWKGMEFYPGEAMTALMEVYHHSTKMPGILEEETREAVIPAMKRAYSFYSDLYHQGEMDTNYNIWQVQAFARLYHALLQDSNECQEVATLVAKYVLELCEDICQSLSWKLLARGPSFYPNLQTLEIACGLDAIIQGTPVAASIGDERKATLFFTHAKNAVNFLKIIQDQIPPNVKVGSGGLGYGGIQVLEQRLDVTGHAISALTKLYQVIINGPKVL